MPRKRKISTFLEVEKHNGIWFFWERKDNNKVLAGFVVGNRLAELIINEHMIKEANNKELIK